MHEGVGGYPLVLLHGYPETKRIWWRNIAPLAAAGYEVIVPDLRGHGESDVDPDDRYDIVTYSRDIEALVHGVLGHERCGLVAGDVGAVVAYDLALRFEGLVEGLCYFNTAPPFLVEEYQAAGISLTGFGDVEARPETDYQLRQGQHPDALAAELDTPERRRRYIADFYGHRLWGSRGSFTEADVDFMTEPWAEEGRLAGGLGRLPARPGHPGGRGGAPPLRDDARALPAPLRPRGPGRPRGVHRLLRGGVHEPDRTRWSSPGPATSCSGSGPTCSTALVAGLVLPVPVSRAFARAAAVGWLLLAACGDDGGSQVGGGATGVELTATATRSSLFDSQRTFRLELTNDGDVAVTVASVQLDSPLFEPVPASPRDTQLAPGQRLLLPCPTARRSVPARARRTW